jgi:two-component system response regulator YesN
MSLDRKGGNGSPFDGGATARREGPKANQPQICALVVDDSELVARGLANLVEQSFQDEIALTVKTDAVAASHWIKCNHPDIVITDLEMPGCDGLEIVEMAKIANAWCQVIVYSSTMSTSKVARALQAGALDFVSKFGPTEGILDSVRAARDRLCRWWRELQ